MKIKRILNILPICTVLGVVLFFIFIKFGNDEEKSPDMEVVHATKDVVDNHISKEEFNPECIQIDKLPQKEYDYNSSDESMDFEENYVRLDAIVSEDLKVYGVGDWEQKSVLLVYKDDYFYTGWKTDPGERLQECMIFDFDQDGEDEFAICTNEDIHHDNLYIVELTDDKLWKYHEMKCYDESIDAYIWNQLSYSYEEEDNAIVFSSKNGINKIQYNQDRFPEDNEAKHMNIQPETLNNRNVLIGGHVYNEADGPWLSVPLYSESNTPNFTEYTLNPGELVMCVSIDRVQGDNYGEVYLKMNYSEDGITFSDFDFLNNYDVCY